MKKLINGIHHAALKCDSMDRFEKVIRFYSVVLGMDILRRWGEGSESGAMIDTGSGIIEVFANAADLPGTGAIRHIAFSCDSPDDCIEAVRAAGYRIKLEPQDIIIPSDVPFPARIAFCIGPVGEEIEFFKEK